MNVCLKKILVSRCTEGVYLRWWFNGWHYFNFVNGYEIEMKTESMDVQTSQFFSVISKVERDTRIKSEYSYKITLHGISTKNINGFTGLLLAEKVEQYESSVWREVDIIRGDHLIKEEGTNGYILDFTVTRKELPGASSVYQKTLKLFIGDTLCDLDDDEIVPINKQVNNIAEMQDRQSDFTASFKIRKTRLMRELFELSGEVGANTQFPYQRQECKLIQDNIEVITGGYVVLLDSDDQYYYVSVYSGNLNFFNRIEGLKLSDLTLASLNHTWDVATMALTHSEATPNIDFCYPLCEPSDDGGIIPLTDDGDKAELFGGWVWCFARLKAIWDEIFLNAGYTVTGGDILTSEKFDKLFLPISNRAVSDTSKYHYSVQWSGNHTIAVNSLLAFTGAVIIKGNELFRTGFFTMPYTAKIKYTVQIAMAGFLTPPPTLYLVKGLLGDLCATFTHVSSSGFGFMTFEAEYDATANESLWIVATPGTYLYYMISITEIKDALIAYGSDVEPRLYLPDMTQVEFIKMVCNLFALIPDVTARDRKIRFWNYSELYDNMLVARDWSAYLSERDDRVSYKFGDYAQSNYLKFKQSKDVLENNGRGTLPFDDETLKEEKDIVTLNVSTCDEVSVLTNNFSVTTSRLAFNKYKGDTNLYELNKSIEPRIVYIDYCREDASPVYAKSLWFRATVLPLAGSFGGVEVVTPKVASSLQVSFSTQIAYYASLSRLLTRPNIRTVLLNLPVYEVAGLKHNIPIYLSQYKAYFYVNKISNYVPGKLCKVDLIRL